MDCVVGNRCIRLRHGVGAVPVMDAFYQFSASLALTSLDAFLLAVTYLLVTE